VLFGGYSRLNKQELICAMAPRATVDMLVTEYFNNTAIDSGNSPPCLFVPKNLLL
jgi:hypothetical protein